MAEDTFTKELLQKYSWGKDPFVFRGKKYRVSKMSYGDYFFEPWDWKGGETDGFAKGTLWLKGVANKPNLYELDNDLNDEGD